MINQSSKSQHSHKDNNLDDLNEEKVALRKNNPDASNSSDPKQEKPDDKQSKPNSRPNTAKSKRKESKDDNQEPEKKENEEEDKKSEREEEPQKRDDEQHEDQAIKRTSLRSIRNSSKLMRKYKERSKNSSRVLDEPENKGQSIRSSKSFIKHRKLSSALNQPSQHQNSQRKDNSDQMRKLDQENKRLKNKSAFLMQQLKNIEMRLNKQLGKRGSPVAKKNMKSYSLESVSNKQIQNAEKRCKIYQKQIVGLKAKVTLFSQEKVNELTDKVQKLEQANAKLEEEKKQLKKNCKHFQKIIDQMGDGDYLKIREQNQQLKKQNRKLKEKLKKQEQQQRMEKVSANNEKAKTKKENEKKEQEKKKEEQKQQKEINILKSKSQRDDKKIKALIYEGNQHKEKNEQLNKQIEDKNKEIEALKQKIKSMRRLDNKSSKNKKNQAQDKEKDKDKNEDKKDEAQDKKNEDTSRKGVQKKSARGKSSRTQERSVSKQKDTKQGQKEKPKQSDQSKKSEKQQKKKHSSDENGHSDEQRSKGEKDPIKKVINQIKDNDKKQKKQKEQNSNKSQKNEDKEKHKQESKPNQSAQKGGKYPRKMQKGQGNSESYKWNHHAFSSKVKLVEVMPHPNGHIKCLNFRYEKGEPPRVLVGNYASFVCDENNGEFIKQISGGFKGGVLQYIKVTTNKKRQSTFCKHEISQQCDNFAFGVDENEYPSAFFGENINESVVRLGCFVQALKQK